METHRRVQKGRRLFISTAERFRVLHAELCSSLVQHENKSHRVTEKRRKRKGIGFCFCEFIFITSICLTPALVLTIPNFFLLPLSFLRTAVKNEENKWKTKPSTQKKHLRRSRSQISFNKLSKVTKTKASRTNQSDVTQILSSYMISSKGEVDAKEPEYFKFYQK